MSGREAGSGRFRFFDFPEEIRKIIYTTNAVESLYDAAEGNPKSRIVSDPSLAGRSKNAIHQCRLRCRSQTDTIQPGRKPFSKPDIPALSERGNRSCIAQNCFHADHCHLPTPHISRRAAIPNSSGRAYCQSSHVSRPAHALDHQTQDRFHGIDDFPCTRPQRIAAERARQNRLSADG
jgi:hypothetical protein